MAPSSAYRNAYATFLVGGPTKHDQKRNQFVVCVNRIDDAQYAAPPTSSRFASSSWLYGERHITRLCTHVESLCCLSSGICGTRKTHIAPHRYRSAYMRFWSRHARNEHAATYNCHARQLFMLVSSSRQSLPARYISFAYLCVVRRPRVSCVLDEQ